jgi:hypothetical protein
MLRRKCDMSGRAGGGGAGGCGGVGNASTGAGCGSGVDSVSGGAAHAASDIAARPIDICRKLVTQTNTQYVDLGNTQAAAQHVEFIEVIRRADTHPVIGLVVDRYALDR